MGSFQFLFSQREKGFNLADGHIFAKIDKNNLTPSWQCSKSSEI